jgi:hypothetical protein
MSKRIAFFTSLITMTFALSATAGERDISYSTACTPTNNQATLSFVGDILIHKALYLTVVNGTKQFSQLWNKTDPLIQKANFSVANLEGPVAMGIDSQGRDKGDIGFVYDGNVYSGTNFQFNYHPRIMTNLKNSGYDLIQTANNHAVDRFSVGIDKTIDAAREADLLYTGSVKSNEPNSPFYTITQVNKINVAFIACTEFSNIPDNSSQVHPCITQKLVTMIKQLSSRPTIDAVIVMPHWGVEYSNTPASHQKEWARKYLEAGAVAVVGAHPHVLQPWEKYVTTDGRETVIIYSLGNFVAGQGAMIKRTGTVAYIGLSKTEGKAKIFGVAHTPTYRQDSAAIPIGSNGPKDVLSYSHSMYGTARRLEPAADLMSLLCAK